jgi:hypothetical protein
LEFSFFGSLIGIFGALSGAQLFSFHTLQNHLGYPISYVLNLLLEACARILRGKLNGNRGDGQRALSLKTA